jgi:hypothetical protein
MNWKKKPVFTAISVACAKRYPPLWTAVLFAVLPVLLRVGSSYGNGTLLFTFAGMGVRAVPFMEVAVFLASLVGFLKYGSHGHVLAYALWVVTFLSVAVLGIVMFEAFSPPWEWSGSLLLPAVVALSCCAGMMSGAGIRVACYCGSRFCGSRFSGERLRR